MSYQHQMKDKMQYVFYTVDKSDEGRMRRLAENFQKTTPHTLHDFTDVYEQSRLLLQK